MSTRAFVPRDEVTVSGPPERPTRLPDHNGRLAVFDLDRTLLPGSSLSLFGRALHRAGMVGNRRMAGYLAREAVFVRRGQGVSAAPPAQGGSSTATSPPGTSVSSPRPARSRWWRPNGWPVLTI